MCFHALKPHWSSHLSLVWRLLTDCWQTPVSSQAKDQGKAEAEELVTKLEKVVFHCLDSSSELIKRLTVYSFHVVCFVDEHWAANQDPGPSGQTCQGSKEVIYMSFCPMRNHRIFQMSHVFVYFSWRPHLFFPFFCTVIHSQRTPVVRQQLKNTSESQSAICVHTKICLGVPCQTQNIE